MTYSCGSVNVWVRKCAATIAAACLWFHTGTLVAALLPSLHQETPNSLREVYGGVVA